MTQKDKIVEVLEREGQIDNFYCINNKLTLRLAARINDLRNAGWEIATEARDDKNTVYLLIGKPAPKQLALV